MRPTRAIAVCYRTTPSGVEILLVRSRSGPWTLPGGRVDPGESPRDGAVRELREESGAVGNVVGEPVANVRVLKGPRDVFGFRAASTPVFLVREEGRSTEDEPWRTPTWFAASRALVALSEGRRWWTPKWRVHALLGALAALGAPRDTRGPGTVHR